MKALKIVGILLLLVVLGVGGLVFYGVQNIDRLVEMTVERVGSNAVGTSVELGAAQIGLREGSGTLTALTVENPAGYRTEHALALGTIALDLDPRSLAGDVITIEEIRVEGAVINAEEKDLRQTNLTDLAQQVEQRLAATQSGPPEEQTGDPGMPRLRVERFVFGDSSINLSSPRFGDRTIDLPAINANDLGGAEGLPPEALAGELLAVVLRQARDAVRREAEGRARDRLRDEAQERLQENLSEENKEKLDELRSLLNR